MNYMAELEKREQLLRNKVRDGGAGGSGVSAGDRLWVADHVAGMRTILSLHLLSIPVEKRRSEEYRLEIVLPVYTDLSRAYALYHREPLDVR